MKITAIANEKGGVGKTTTVATLGHALARAGERVLIVDLDPQANLSDWLGAEEAPAATMAEALLDRAAMAGAIGPTAAEGLMLAYGSRAVAETADELRASSPAPALALRRALRGLEFDRILIDCPPGLGVLSVNALTAADSLIVPVNSQAMAIAGAIQLGTTLQELLEAEVIQQIPERKVLLTMYDPRRALAREVREYLADQEGAPAVLETTIRQATRMAECFGQHLTIYDYAPREAVAEDYTRLAEELRNHVAAR